MRQLTGCDRPANPDPTFNSTLMRGNNFRLTSASLHPSFTPHEIFRRIPPENAMSWLLRSAVKRSSSFRICYPSRPDPAQPSLVRDRSGVPLKRHEARRLGKRNIICSGGYISSFLLSCQWFGAHVFLENLWYSVRLCKFLIVSWCVK